MADTFSDAREWLMNARSLQANSSFYRMIRAHGKRALVDSFMVRRPSVSERMAWGKALRKQTPRAALAIYEKRKNRPDPIEILERQNVSRVRALVPVRYGRMLANPFGFLRGAAAIMASDLSKSPVSGTRVAACGDAHVKNFGVYASAERNLIFSINDFDEVYVGPWEWDLKRLTASAVVATQFMGGDKAKSEQAARECVRLYRKRICKYAEMGYLDVWYDRIDERAVLDGLAPGARRIAYNIIDKVRHIRPLEKLTEQVNGRHRFIEDVPLIVHESRSDSGTPIKLMLDRILRAYVDSLSYDRKVLLSRYQFVDFARKVVGVGSVGTRCWVLLLQGIESNDSLFLQVKQAQRSVLEPYADLKLPFTNQGRRVVFGQRLTQGSPDIFLGWGRVDGNDFYVRQLAELKGDAAFDNFDTFLHYCGLCGWALALAHAKSGDPATIAGYCGKSDALDEAIAKFAMSYSKQTEEDLETLVKAKRAGRIKAATK
jgi:uncharacterized protein (DUF2252 family)